MTDIVAQVRRHLNEIPELLLEASHYLTPGTAPKDPDNRHGSSIYRLPVVAEIVDLLDEREKDVDDISLNRNGSDRRLGALPTLSLWVALAWPELADMGANPRECCPARNHTISGEGDWLAEYAPQIIELHPEFPRDIELLHNELRKACRIRHEYIPKCGQCGHKVEGVYGTEEDQHAAWYRCTGCGKAIVLDAELKRMALTQPRMTLRQIATWLSIPLRTLHNWRNQGRFVTDHRGMAEVEHVKRAAEAAGRISA